VSDPGGGARFRRKREHRGRQIPWLPVVRFHKEIVARAEEGFFSVGGRDDQNDRWSSLLEFDPVDLAGPWVLGEDQLRSQPFRLALEQNPPDSLFLGGPCFLGWSRSLNGRWVPQWRPLLYREVAVVGGGDDLEFVPQQGAWSLTPLLYGLFERMEFSLDVSLDDFATSVIELAAGYGQTDGESLGSRIFRALYSKLPGAEEAFHNDARPDTFKIPPTPWVLFAPTNSFSALTRHLMKDYERLESLLSKPNADIGGLRLLEDHQPSAETEGADVLPLVPLNPSQRHAVQRVLELRPLTVVSGPPGTGKSQAVVALLLNAWAQGKTVLFASNNNKAVDVVRERVERFESEFPIAVRAGNKQRQNVEEVLRRTLNMAGATPESGGKGVDPTKVRRKRQKLLDERTALLETLESHLPQRIDESLRTALRAYGECRASQAELTKKEKSLLEDLDGLGFAGRSAADVESAIEETRKWLGRVHHYRDLVESDDATRRDLGALIVEQERARDRAAEEVGLSSNEVHDWRWLISGPGADQVGDWEQRLRELLDKPIEETLEPIAWQEEYGRWHSSEDADRWAQEARAFAELVSRTCAELAPKFEAIRNLRESLDRQRAGILEVGLSEETELSAEVLRDWTACYSEMATAEPGAFDWLPWSARSDLKKRLRALERQLRPGLPLHVLAAVGTLDDEGRHRLAPIVDVSRRWLEARREWEGAKDLVEDTERRFYDLRSQAGALRLESIPTGPEESLWVPVVVQCEKGAEVAEHAATAWRRRVKKEAMEQELRTIGREWARLGSGVPLREAWSREDGRSFDASLRALVDQPDRETIAGVRRALYSGSLAQLSESWERASKHEREATRLRAELAGVPEPSDRVEAWWKERPSGAFVLTDGPVSDWPDIVRAEAELAKVVEWLARWNRFTEEEKPESLRKAEEEETWAIEKLEQAIQTLPDGSTKKEATTILDGVREDASSEWPVEKLGQAFAAFSPDRIRARVERLEGELERASFDDAKAAWLERLGEDDEAVRAVDALEKSLRQYKGTVVESHYGTFRTALRAVPVWITTAQASQAIPLEPELFDIVVIDEASQCTLTNLLPLMYRGKTLAVIGDDNQLPAIPTIQESEELALARKFDIEEHLALVGHATNDVYKTAAQSLPRRRADVIMLDEHFRSHPQIIGFSNRHIYLQRLELKKDPSWGQRFPIGSGVHSVPVVGTARRGDNGRSWINEPEAEAVLDLVKQLKEGDTRALSVGVVTPFAAQKEYLRERLDSLRLASEVLVDTAYGFQGDERDVILFSPVVGKGITASACRWVESPPNLVNVAITRAREALFVVGDLDYCLQQEGILRKLALYCRDIQLLRDTSVAELELFSWMVVKGWEPRVHPRIGDIEVDFTLQSSSGVRLAIEVDGREHQKRSEEDKARDAYLVGQSYDVLRVPAREVLETPFEVVHQIEVKLGDEG